VRFELNNGGDAIEALALIRDESSFKRLFVTQPDAHLRRSIFREDNRLSLEEWKTIDDLQPDEIKCYMKAFQVPKSNLIEDRLIVDATPLNRVQSKPLEMHLPALHEVLEGVCRFRFAFTVDAVSYFYQFEVAEAIRNYFGIAFNRRRGAAHRRRLARMCMGWKFSPCIAQRTSLALLREMRVRLALRGVVDFFSSVWLDNFIFAANRMEDLLAIRECFLQICLEANVTLHPCTEITDSISILGFQISLLSKEIVHSTKWISKVEGVLTRLRAENASIRDVARAVGCLVWTSFARRLPLAMFPNFLGSLRVLAMRLQEGDSWDSNAGDMISVQFRQEVCEAWKLIQTPFTMSKKAVMHITAFSDAQVDSNFASWAFCTDSVSMQGRFKSRHHIFFHELQAAAQTLVEIAHVHQRCHVDLGVDNTACMFALRSGHSGNSIADDWLRQLYLALPPTFTFQVFHIGTGTNPADKFTRGVRASFMGHSGDLPTWRAREFQQSIMHDILG